jgi:hypothetical protein
MLSLVAKCTLSYHADRSMPSMVAISCTIHSNFLHHSQQFPAPFTAIIFYIYIQLFKVVFKVTGGFGCWATSCASSDAPPYMVTHEELLKHKNTHTYTHACMDACTRTDMHACTHLYTCTRTHTCMHAITHAQALTLTQTHTVAFTCMKLFLQALADHDK